MMLMMKRKLITLVMLSACCMLAPAQTLRKSNEAIIEAFADSLKENRASYFAHFRVWEDLEIPAPKVRPNGNYYKLFVPPTYYTAPVEQAFHSDGEWYPGKKLSMSAVDSLYAVWTDTVPRFELPRSGNAKEVDEWVNKLLLDFYMEHPEKVTGNELYFADVKVLNESQTIATPREEKIKNFMHIENPAENTNVDSELLVVKPNFWKYTGLAKVHFTQYSISDNWYQGGESTNALVSELKLTANYDDKQRVQFENSLEIKVGFITAPSDTVHNYKTNADLFRINSKLGVRAVKNLYYTLSAQFKTQFFPNYKTNTNDMISNFFSPAQLDLSLGMDYKLEKKKYKLSLMGAPFSYTFVYIANDSIVNPSAFNVKEGRSTASLFGSKITANLDWKIAKNISYVSKLEYFTTYEKVIASWENTFNFNLNKYLSTQVFIHARFDDGVTLTEDNDSYFQLKEMLTFGLTYTW